MHLGQQQGRDFLAVARTALWQLKLNSGICALVFSGNCSKEGILLPLLKLAQGSTNRSRQGRIGLLQVLLLRQLLQRREDLAVAFGAATGQRFSGCLLAAET